MIVIADLARPRRPGRALRLLAAFAILLAAAPAAAQETRAEAIAQAQAEKAARTAHYSLTRAERYAVKFEEVLQPASGFYPWFGSIYSGGWLAAGPGYRLPVGDAGSFDVHAAWSLRNYRGVGARFALPPMAGNRVRVRLDADWFDAPRVVFHGIGNDSGRDVQASYRYRPTTLSATAELSPLRWVTVGGSMAYVRIDSGPGTFGDPIDVQFSVADLPGLDADPSYVRPHAFAEIDWREAPGYTRSGGLYRVDWYDYRARSGPYGFRRTDAEVRQYIPILRGNWIIALRALASVTDTDPGDQVPLTLLPSLGGSSSLRGYSSWRFRDEHRMLLSGEYRWTPGRYLDMALFVDAGKVASRRRDLDLQDLKTSYGIGIRFHTPEQTVLRFEVARTREGTGFIVGFGPAF